MNFTNRSIGLISLGCFSAALQGQVPNGLGASTRLLQTQVSLDQSTYFPGEAAVVTVTVTNPTASRLQVMTPFATATGCLLLFVQQPDGSFLPSAADRCASIGATSFPTTTMAPGESRQVTLNSYDGMFDSSLPPMGSVGVPRRPGSYALTYKGIQALFNVVLPHLDAAAAVPSLAGSYTDPTTGKVIQTQGYEHVFALRWNGVSYICATVQGSGGPQVISNDPNGNFTDANGNFIGASLFKRIAVSQNPVVSMSVTADGSGNHTVTWQDSTGGVFTGNFTEQFSLQRSDTPAGGGWVIPMDTHHYNPGTTVNLIAIPSPGFAFLSWTGDAVANPNSAATTITMNNNYSVTANFVLTSPAPAPLNISGQVQVTTSNPSFGGGRILENLTLSNTAGQYVSGPISVVLTNLSPGFTLANATGTYNGSPYVQIQPDGLLAPGQSYTTVLQFSVGPTAVVRFTPVTYSGL